MFKNVGASAKVAILLATYCGGRFLAEQLDSFVAQTYSDWELWASDDGSNDDTIAILEAYKCKIPLGRLSILSGPRNGITANFFALILNQTIKAEYYAYSDQDDIWDADKLERAVTWLNSVSKNIPALYCSRTRLIDEIGGCIGESCFFNRKKSFANALVQNVAGGNTMVFNHAAMLLLRECKENYFGVMHDWWTYIVVSGCGGVVFYDTRPSLSYRQHANNAIGANSSFAARLTRVRQMRHGRFKNWNDANIMAISKIQEKFTLQNRVTLTLFARARQMSLLPRLVYMLRSGVYRQTFLGNIGLFFAVVFRKI